MSLYFELPFCISESRFLGLPEKYGLSFNIRNSLPKVLSYIVLKPPDEGESSAARSICMNRFCSDFAPSPCVWHSWSTASLALCRVGQNLIDSFSQDFTQVVRSRCRCYLFRPAFVLVALRWLRVLCNWLSYWAVTLRTQTRSCSHSGMNKSEPIKAQFCWNVL